MRLIHEYFFYKKYTQFFHRFRVKYPLRPIHGIVLYASIYDTSIFTTNCKAVKAALCLNFGTKVTAKVIENDVSRTFQYPAGAIINGKHGV